MFMGSFVDDQNHPFSVLNAEIAKLKDLNSKIELLTSVISRLEALAKQAEARVASEAERAEQAERRVASESERAEQAEQARENLRTEVNALQAQLKEKEQHLQASD